MNALLPHDLWAHVIYSYLDETSICSFEKVCIQFNNISSQNAKVELLQFFDQHNKYFEYPLEEVPIKEEELLLVEHRIGIKLPNIVREFLKITNGRNPIVDYEEGHLEHFTNTLAPLQGWWVKSNRWIDIGGARSEFGAVDIYLNFDTCQVKLYQNRKYKTMGFRDYIFGLKYTSNPYNMAKLCENRELLKEVLFKNGKFLINIPNLQRDREFVKYMLLEKCNIYSKISDNFKLEFCEIALAQNINNYRFAPNSVKLKRELAMKYIENNPKHKLKAIPLEILDKEMILKSGKLHCGLPFKFMTAEITLSILNAHPFSMGLYNFIIGTGLSSCFSIRMKLFEFRPICLFGILKTINHEVFKFDKSVILKCFNTYEPQLVTFYSDLIEELPNDLLLDYDIAKECLLFSFKNYSKLSDNLKTNRDLMRECLKSMTNHDLQWLRKEKVHNQTLFQLACENPNYRIYLTPEEINEDYINSLSFYPYENSMISYGIGRVMETTRFEHFKVYLNTLRTD